MSLMSLSLRPGAGWLTKLFCKVTRKQNRRAHFIPQTRPGKLRLKTQGSEFRLQAAGLGSLATTA